MEQQALVRVIFFDLELAFDTLCGSSRQQILVSFRYHCTLHLRAWCSDGACSTKYNWPHLCYLMAVL